MNFQFSHELFVITKFTQFVFSFLFFDIEVKPQQPKFFQRLWYPPVLSVVISPINSYILTYCPTNSFFC